MATKAIRIALIEAPWFGRERAVGYAKMMAIAFAPPLVWFYFQAIGPLGSDFTSFWSAGKLVLAGHAADVYSPSAERAIQAQFGRDHWWPFLNPPPFLFFVAPFALAPFAISWPIWVASTYAAWLACAKRLVAGGFWPIAVFPGAMVSAWHAQNGFVTGAFFVAATLMLARRPFLAGALFGALVIKPHLALLVPIALLAGRQWKAIAGAAVSSIGMLALSALAFGPDTLGAYLATVSLDRQLLASPSIEFLQRMPTVYADLALAYGAVVAGWIQAGTSLTMAVVVAWIWSRQMDVLAQCAVLALATVLATPYLFVYDLVLLIIPVCWAAREGMNLGFRPWDKVILAIFYWSPLLTRSLCRQTGANLMPLFVLGFMIFTLSRTGIFPREFGRNQALAQL